jgi:hypothetical protein
MQQLHYNRHMEETNRSETGEARALRILKSEFSAACETYYHQILGAIHYTINTVKTQWTSLDTSANVGLEYVDIENGYVHLGNGVGRFCWQELLHGVNPKVAGGDPAQNLFDVTGVAAPFLRARTELAKLGYTLTLEDDVKFVMKLAW